RGEDAPGEAAEAAGDGRADAGSAARRAGGAALGAGGHAGVAEAAGIAVEGLARLVGDAGGQGGAGPHAPEGEEAVGAGGVDVEPPGRPTAARRFDVAPTSNACEELAAHSESAGRTQRRRRWRLAPYVPAVAIRGATTAPVSRGNNDLPRPFSPTGVNARML